MRVRKLVLYSNAAKRFVYTVLVVNIEYYVSTYTKLQTNVRLVRFLKCKLRSEKYVYTREEDYLKSDSIKFNLRILIRVTDNYKKMTFLCSYIIVEKFHHEQIFGIRLEKVGL